MTLYTRHFETMAGLDPVIIKLKWARAFSVIAEWRMGPSAYQVEGIRFVSEDIYYTGMKPGFVDRFKVLDIMKDIESIPSVGPDGRMVFQKININNNFKDKQSNFKPLTPEEAEEIARKRGLL